MVSSIESSLSRVRRQKTPKLPSSSDFEIPPFYSVTLDDRRFLLADITKHKKRIIIFSTDEQLSLLFKAKQVMMDGTFDACPPHFDRIYTLHAIKHGRCKSLSSLLSYQLAFILFSLAYPCAIALLSGRSTTIYRQLFNELESQATRLQLDFNPVRIMSDFEKALIKAVRQQVSYFRMVFAHTCSVSLLVSSIASQWMLFSLLSSPIPEDPESRSCISLS